MKCFFIRNASNYCISFNGLNICLVNSSYIFSLAKTITQLCYMDVCTSVADPGLDQPRSTSFGRNHLDSCPGFTFSDPLEERRFWIRVLGSGLGSTLDPDPDLLFQKEDSMIWIRIHYSGMMDPRIRIHCYQMWIRLSGSTSR